MLVDYKILFWGSVTIEFRKQDKSIQILHVPGHWLTVTNYGAPKNTVFLLDSLGGISDSAVSQLWRILGQGIEIVILSVNLYMPRRMDMIGDCLQSLTHSALQLEEIRVHISLIKMLCVLMCFSVYVTANSSTFLIQQHL
ncbi:unnamed protein product, partial [Ixodes pacificus]